MTAADRHMRELAEQLRTRLIELRRTQAAAGEEGEGLAAAISQLVEAEAAVLSPGRRSKLAELILRDTVGLGPIEELLADPAVRSAYLGVG